MNQVSESGADLKQAKAGNPDLATARKGKDAPIDGQTVDEWISDLGGDLATGTSRHGRPDRSSTIKPSPLEIPGIVYYFILFFVSSCTLPFGSLAATMPPKKRKGKASRPSNGEPTISTLSTTP